jgi:hypothetical protein
MIEAVKKKCHESRKTWALPTEKKVNGIAISIAPITPPAIMKKTSLLNEKSTLASWGFILLIISTRMFLICILKDIRGY